MNGLARNDKSFRRNCSNCLPDRTSGSIVGLLVHPQHVDHISHHLFIISKVGESEEWNGWKINLICDFIDSGGLEPILLKSISFVFENRSQTN